jgi:uncharacterized protein (TIGR02996 family)
MSREVLWQAILEHPEDREVRLIYADWLEEHSDNPDDLARAALIRAQIEAENHPPRSRSGKPFRDAAVALVKEHADRWKRPLMKAHRFRRPQFIRGFIEHVVMNATDFAHRAEHLFEQVPTLQSVEFYQASNEIETVLRTPHLLRLRRADFSDLCQCGRCPIQNEIRALCQSPMVANLRYLGLRQNRIDLETLEVLASSTQFANLRELDLRASLHMDPSVRVIRIFRQSPWLSQLERLDLRENAIGLAAQGYLRRHFPDRVLLDPE